MERIERQSVQELPVGPGRQPSGDAADNVAAVREVALAVAERGLETAAEEQRGASLVACAQGFNRTI